MHYKKGKYKFMSFRLTGEESIKVNAKEEKEIREYSFFQEIFLLKSKNPNE